MGADRFFKSRHRGFKPDVGIVTFAGSGAHRKSRRAAQPSRTNRRKREPASDRFNATARPENFHPSEAEFAPDIWPCPKAKFDAVEAKVHRVPKDRPDRRCALAKPPPAGPFWPMHSAGKNRLIVVAVA